MTWANLAGEGDYEVEVITRDNDTGETVSTSRRIPLTSRVAGGMPAVSPTSHPLVKIYSAPACPAGSAMSVRFVGPEGDVQRTPARECTPDRSLNFYVTDSLKESLKETINSKIEDGFRHFILNLDNVKIIDSCGVGLIIVANNVTASRNAKLYLSNIKPFIIKIFEIMRISKHLSIFEKEDDALQVIKSSR